MVPVYFIDQLIALVPPYAPANYFLLAFPPPMGSIVDLFAQVFGPAPWYVLGFEIMGIGVFGILWLPWAVARRVRRATVRTAWQARREERRLAIAATA
jgi:uncharacterized membrane protein YwaF